MSILDAWICMALQTFITGVILGCYHHYYFTENIEVIKELPSQNPYKNDIDFNDAFHLRVRNLINTKEKCESLGISEPVHVLRYFILPPISTKLTKDIILNTSCPMVGFVGQETNRLYLFPVLILFPDLQG